MTWRGPLVGVAAAVAAIVPLPPEAIERFYVQGAYRSFQPWVTTASNLVPFALLDALLVVLTVSWLTLAARDLLARPLHPSRLRGAARVVARTVTWAAVLYLVFLAAWGLNYRRLPMRNRLRFDASAVTPDAVRALAYASTDRVNALHDVAHRIGWAPVAPAEPGLIAAFARANAAVGGTRTVVGRPKSTLLDWYFRRAAVDGMTDPFALETLVSGDLLPFERPFVVAHEWSHLAGLADEGEANFLGWLTCAQGTSADQYSGWLFLHAQLAQAVSARDRTELMARLADGPRADLRALADRVARSVQPQVAAAGWRAYDTYLKANRVAAGARSYAEVVRLVTGTRFGPDWTPEMRGSLP